MEASSIASRLSCEQMVQTQGTARSLVYQLTLGSPVLCGQHLKERGLSAVPVDAGAPELCCAAQDIALLALGPRGGLPVRSLGLQRPALDEGV